MRGWLVVAVLLGACGGGRGGDEDGYDEASHDLVETALEDCVSQAVLDGLACEGEQIPGDTCLAVAQACANRVRIGFTVDCGYDGADWQWDCRELARLGSEVDACTDGTQPDLWPRDPLIYECAALHEG